MGSIPGAGADQGHSKTSTYLVQEFCNSGSLQKVIEQQMSKASAKLKVYTTFQVLEWMIDIAQGIKYLHEASPKILHRDMKLGGEQQQQYQILACLMFAKSALLA